MKPLSPHWADISAFKAVQAKKNKDSFVVASGITPSGTVHIGNFREVITVDLVARGLRSLGKQVKFIYSWDNFDTFRKVPKNVPDIKETSKFLRQPIARIPDPWNEASSYAGGRIQQFQKELSEVGIKPQFLYQEEKYSSGEYAADIRKALEHKDEIKEILNEHRSQALAADWLPTSCYCSQCQRDEMSYQRYDGEWNYSYHCAFCQHEETVDLRKSKNVKLAWRIDWPMRWAFEKVDFEPGGKDHSSQGGSFDTSKNIVKKIWQQEPPIYLQYDFVSLKGTQGKMSSSSGELVTLGEVLEVYEPQIVRWIFANHRPNHDFSISFDEDVIKIYEEFDRAEATALGAKPEKPGRWPIIRRTYELSLLEEKLPAKTPKRSSFRLLCNRLQICALDPKRTFTKFYAQELSDDEAVYYWQRVKRALHWLNNYAPEEFCYQLNSKAVSLELTKQQESALKALSNLISKIDLDAIELKDLNDKIWQEVVHEASCDAKEAFKAIYQKLILRDQGPRLPSFLKEIGREKLLELLS